METIKNIYLKNSNNKMTRKELEDLLTHDLLLSSSKCVELGLVDEIIG